MDAWKREMHNLDLGYKIVNVEEQRINNSNQTEANGNLCPRPKEIEACL
jgi:hypothetical protein